MGMLSGPVDVVVSSPSSNLCVLLVKMSMGAIEGKCLCGMLSDRLCSCVYTDWNCVEYLWIVLCVGY